MQYLNRNFFERDTVIVAQELLGKILVSEHDNLVVSGIIIETEAYCGLEDPASHAFGGKNKKNMAMFGPVGHAYVYKSYGIHLCLNCVARATDMQAGGVLIRSVKPVAGIDIMKQRRHVKVNNLNANNLRQLASGPGNVGQAFGIKLSDNGVDLTHKNPHLYLLSDPQAKKVEFKSTPRIGISKHKDICWRFLALNI